VTARHDLPFVAGVLGPEQVASTAAAVASVQEPDGAIPWSVGAHTDTWNHVESAMGLLVGGEVAAAERAYAWVPPQQRADGSFPWKVVAGVVEDDRGEANMAAYVAVGVWHHWLVRRDRRFVEAMWPVVRSALDWVVSRQLPFGGIAWCQFWVDGVPVTGDEDVTDALLAGSSSIYQSLRAGVAIAELLGDPQPDWELAGGRLGHAVREHRDLFLDKSTFSMDWYYPVLGGAVRGAAARALLDERWDDFVVPGLGIHCVDTNPWVTGAETCELVMALDAEGDHERARTLLVDMQHLRHESGAYFTGWVYGDDVYWPRELTAWTGAAVILAVDALGETYGHSTPGSGIMRGTSLAPDFAELLLECGCHDVPAGHERRAPGTA
jgi:hypothetical protein